MPIELSVFQVVPERRRGVDRFADTALRESVSLVARQARNELLNTAVYSARSPLARPERRSRAYVAARHVSWPGAAIEAMLRA
ncbi:MAG TPA: hypothetical protein VLM79_29430 [Kofleriaceae bacterium]|nr:hypothetical protein [Kofleriaceae bacterium]